MKKPDNEEIVYDSFFSSKMKCSMKVHNGHTVMVPCMHTVFALVKCWKCLQNVRLLFIM